MSTTLSVDEALKLLNAFCQLDGIDEKYRDMFTISVDDMPSIKAFIILLKKGHATMPPATKGEFKTLHKTLDPADYLAQVEAELAAEVTKLKACKEMRKQLELDNVNLINQTDALTLKHDAELKKRNQEIARMEKEISRFKAEIGRQKAENEGLKEENNRLRASAEESTEIIKKLSTSLKKCRVELEKPISGDVKMGDEDEDMTQVCWVDEDDKFVEIPETPPSGGDGASSSSSKKTPPPRVSAKRMLDD